MTDTQSLDSNTDIVVRYEKLLWERDQLLREIALVMNELAEIEGELPDERLQQFLPVRKAK